MCTDAFADRVLRTALRLLALVAFGLLFANPAAATPKIEHWETANGARVYFVAAHELPMVDVRVVLDAGSARDAGRPGLARLTNSLLGEGAGGRSADALSEEFSRLGARFSSGSARDMAWLSLRSITAPDKLQGAVRTLALVLQHPDFPAKAFARQQSRMLVALEAKRQSPADLARDAFYSALYGDHPYASPPDGTVAGVRGITVQDARRFYARYYTARNAVIAIVGDLDRAQAERLAARLAKGLRAGSAAPALPPVKPLSRPVTKRIAYPSEQTHILVGQAGMRRNDPQYFPLYIGNHILGGNGLVTRLSNEIREKRALSYSVYSYFIPMHVRGPFIAGLQTRNAKAAEALSVLRATIARFVARGPSAREVADAKKNISGGFPLTIDSNRNIVEYVAAIGFYRLPLDYLDTYVGRVEAVPRRAIRKAFRQRLHPKTMVTVIVGPEPAEGHVGTERRE